MTHDLRRWREAYRQLPGRDASNDLFIAAFEHAVEALRADVNEDKFRLWLETRQLGRLTASLKWHEFAEVLREEAQAAYIETIRKVGQAELDRVVGKENRLHLRFDLTNPRVITWAERNANRLVVELTSHVRAALNAVILHGLNVLPPRDLAPLILNSGLGLHTRWANAVINRAAQLGVRASHPAVTSYARTLLRARSRMIARTETMFAQNAGRMESWRQMQAEGFLRRGAMKEWLTGPQPCEVCMDLDSEVVPLNADFSNGDDMPPAHPHCVCTAIVVFEGG